MFKASFSKLDIGDHSGSGVPLIRRRSTLIFDDEDDAPRHKEDVGEQEELQEFGGHSSESSSSASVFAQQQQQTPPVQAVSEHSVNNGPRVMIPVEITWQQGGSKVYVTGSFTGWRKMIGLVPVPDQPGLFHIKLQLPLPLS